MGGEVFVVPENDPAPGKEWISDGYARERRIKQKTTATINGISTLMIVQFL